MDDIDDLVRRSVAGVASLAGRAAAFGLRLLLGVTVVCVGGFLLGVAALSNGIETVWIVLGVAFGSVAIGGVFVAWWRATMVRRHAPGLADEVRTLLADGRESSRTVVETFVVDTDRTPDGSNGSAIVFSRQLHGFGDVAGTGLEHAVRLRAAVRALTTFPFQVLVSVLISCVFAFLGLIFLIALAL